MYTMTRDEVLQSLRAHGLTSTEQTATLWGQLVPSGSSFDEEVGVKTSYTLSEVKTWLGY